jgi:hypothetical protein
MIEAIITFVVVMAIMSPISCAFYNRVLEQERNEELRRQVDEIKELLKKREGGK